jgi:hypothetical protein
VLWNIPFINQKGINNFIRRLYKQMFKELFSGLNKFFNRKEFVMIVIVVLIAFALLSYTNSKTIVLDGLADGSDIKPYGSSVESYSEVTNSLASQPSMLETSAQHVVPPPTGATMAGGYDLNPSSNASDLLPSDSNSDWAKLNPAVGAGMTPDLLQAGYHIGLDTVGQTLRNANLQLRSDPIIPKQNVGPWLQSTIEPDLGRVPLDIGSGAY